jgi:SAM-dependent methyltransferase
MVEVNSETANTETRIERALAGETLYGDDFSEEEIAQWFEDEREGYFDLYYGDKRNPVRAPETYEYAGLAELHGFRWLAARTYDRVLGVGSAHGAELLPVLGRTRHLTVLEPSEGFAHSDIHGTPVEYVKPDASGVMPFPSDNFDLIVCLSVLHHVPNVSTVLREMSRVLKPGGRILLREPTHSMGDWRKVRRGLTRRERGIPPAIFREIIDGAGLCVVKETRCMFSLVSRLQRLMRRPVWAVDWVVRMDAFLCSLPLWPSVYHARGTWHKLRPTAVAYVLEKPTESSLASA